MPKSDGGGGEYKPPTNGLNDEEKTGRWVLAGILGLGLLLGGPEQERKKGNKGEHGKERGPEEGKVVKGDAQWEQASGAGVVGHGARKG